MSETNPEELPVVQPETRIVPRANRHGLLSVQQQKFCEEYVITGNAVAAYYTAFGEYRHLKPGEVLEPGQPHPKRGYYTAQQNAHKLLKKRRIQREIDSVKRAARRQALTTIHKLNLHDSWAAFLDVRKFVTANPDGTSRLLQPHELPSDLARCIRKMKVKSRKVKSTEQTTETIEEVEYEYLDPMKAREAIAKRLGIDTPVTPLDELLRVLSPELRAKVWAEIQPMVKGKNV